MQKFDMLNFLLTPIAVPDESSTMMLIPVPDTAVSTPGDLLFHIRSERRDLNFEFEKQLLDLLGDSVRVVDETVGFRYFDVRDLLGFVDGTANPVGPAVPASILVAEEDTAGLGGSYIVVQKYIHDMKGWKTLKAEQQEAIIGRTKLDNVELDDAPSGQQASHKTLSTIEDENGVEHDILRDNMPFGSPAACILEHISLGILAGCGLLRRCCSGCISESLPDCMIASLISLDAADRGDVLRLICKNTRQRRLGLKARSLRTFSGLRK